MSRPPSARPKTSSGRAMTASRRPPTAAPVQQAGSSSNGAVVRPSSRSVLGRLSTAESMRQPTASARPTTGSMIAGAPRPQTGMARPPTAAIRPLTQQGLSGGRAVSRLGTASQRQVFDKSYFIGILRSRIGQLNAEMARLENVFRRGEKDRVELVSYERRAEESALEIKELQGKLIDLNVIIDRMHTNGDMTQIEQESQRIKDSADELDASVQELFLERQQREKEAEELTAAIEEQKRQNQALMASMDPTLRDQYEELKERNEELRSEVNQLQAELAVLDDKKLQLEIELENSPLKQKAVQLYENLATLKKKEEELQTEKGLEETPDQKKQKIIEQIKQGNEEIQTMEKQIEQTNEQIEQYTEELRDFENDESKFVKNNERYRELAMKEQQIEDFLRSYPDEKRLLAMEMEEYSQAIVQNLQNISSNIGQISIESNITDIDAVGMLSSSIRNQASAKDLKEAHVRLQEEMIDLNEMEERLHSEVETLNRRILDLEEQSKEFENGDEDLDETGNDIEHLYSRKELIQDEVEENEKRLPGLQNELSDILSELDANPNYAETKSIRKSLDLLLESNDSLKEQIETREADHNYEVLKKNVLDLQSEYNQLLLSGVNKKLPS
ncbi:unnamed protein product [Auanema sp. JU1783]|nr:unnamed protein product [Auanema sp. JU1783]